MLRRWWWLAAVLVALVVVVATVPSHSGDETDGQRRVASSDERARATKDRGGSEASKPGRDDGRRPTAERRERRARAEALKEKIAQALQRKAAEPAAGRRPHDPDERERPDGDLRNRGGFRPEIMEAINKGFIPLADECIEHARERDPDLYGMVAIELTAIGDPELGAVIESVEFPSNNEVQDAELLECIRETALSTVMPPPPEGGRDQLMITLRTGEE